MPFGAEKESVQSPFIRYAQEVGWTYLSPEEALDRRRGITSPVLDSVLVAQLQRLNPGVVDAFRAEDVAKRLVRVRPAIEGNQDAWEYLKGLRTVFVDEERRERNVRLLDVAHPEANTFHVTDEFRFSNGTPPDIRADIVFFINGVPVLITETKSAKQRNGTEQALEDIRYYHKFGPEFLALAQLFNLTDLKRFEYGATWNTSRKGVFNWRDEQAGDFETLVKTFIAPRRVLRVLSDFILFTVKDDQLSKVVLRPHQMRAVERTVQRAKDPEKKRALIWHTQGSGKTYTMIVTAKRLIEDPVFENPTVLMLVDRNELEAQLFGNLESVGLGNVAVSQSKVDLQRLLASDRRGLIVSMIHKFEDIPPDLNTRSNVFVLVDEAHRTTGGDLGNFLMGSLPNATYLGFTGTPIDGTAHGKGTFKVFGVDDPKGYIDKYSIRESVQDGTTVPLHYSLAPNDLRVDRETLEREFLGLAELEGISDIEELNAALDRAVTLKNMLKNRERVEKVAKFVAEHFQRTVEPMGYKAFLVAVDREACVFYKQALDKYLPAEASAVVMSSGGKSDSDELRSHHITEEEEKRIRKAFRAVDGQPKILIVTEKLLTGFDAPILYCMYLDKPMRDHVLLQAIARVNRPYEDEAGRPKPSGFVLDFVGIFEKLERALAFDSEDVKGVIDGLDVLEDRFGELMDQGRGNFLPITLAKTEDKAVEAVLEHFRDKPRRDDFYEFFGEVEELYEILSPNAFLRPFVDDYRHLAEMFQLLRGNYERGVIVDRSFLRKTAKLVQEHIVTGNVQAPDRVHKLDARALEAIAEGEDTDTAKVFNLLKAVDEMVRDQAREAPYLISIGDKAEEIAREFEARQRTTQETLDELRARVVAEIREAEAKRDETELSPEAFAVYWLLKREGVDPDKQISVAKAVSDAFVQHPHWQVSGHQLQAVKRALYKAFIDAKIDAVVEMAQVVMQMLRRASS